MRPVVQNDKRHSNGNQKQQGGDLPDGNGNAQGFHKMLLRYAVRHCRDGGPGEDRLMLIAG